MATSYDQVVLFGDSLFQGATDILEGFSFQAALQKHCIRRLDVVNRGFSGWNTQDALRYLPEIFPAKGSNETSAPRLRYLLILLGANDACLPHSYPTQYCSLDDYRANLKAIITHPNITAHKPTILLVTPPPLDETRIHQYDILENNLEELTRNAANSAKYSQAARDVAAEVPGTVLVDLQDGLMKHAVSLTGKLESFEYDADGKPLLGYLLKDDEGKIRGRRGGLGQLLPDGLHLSGEAYRVFFDLVRPHIGPFPEKLDDKGEKSEFANPFPDWRILADEREEAKKRSA
ncbi:hypothetical protein JX265_000405 [Neoarthrinium moseri]|uniref:SGNH hydrolase-type esterase domain-containing protein n=1 Tax=Neoarthrinium moseri TaxID=1658444 RepID=A0A9P9WYP7_9PEZI|nr:uncharacterized protein JN550_000655 [Neoarthrinium moseri]KAI1851361.1 hypothetical protein JX266_003436 [Neoarthrinium moseri]KAI1878473.1 hypothetical protein JN550_000655 [Neoarthrinium moseri]KAI1881579.1 hypothetical protein JX265_000405 [Neoarthrinium moseri]